MLYPSLTAQNSTLLWKSLLHLDFQNAPSFLLADSPGTDYKKIYAGLATTRVLFIETENNLDHQGSGALRVDILLDDVNLKTPIPVLEPAEVMTARPLPSSNNIEHQGLVANYVHSVVCLDYHGWRLGHGEYVVQVLSRLDKLFVAMSNLGDVWVWGKLSCGHYANKQGHLVKITNGSPALVLFCIRNDSRSLSKSLKSLSTAIAW